MGANNESSGVTMTHQEDSEMVNTELVIVFQTVYLAILTSIVATFGIISNILNITVFIKQGLTETINVNLLALSISDLCAMITLQWVNLLRNPLFVYAAPVVSNQVQHLSAAWPHACFTRVTSWITVYIALERFLLMVLPMNLKACITPKTSVIVLLSIFIVMFLALIPSQVSFFEMAAATQISAFLAIFILAIILTVRVRKKTKWQMPVNDSGQVSAQGNVKRENKTVKMVILICVVHCICFLIKLTNYILTGLKPEFVIFGLYRNAFLISWSIMFLVDVVNSSVNVLVYYRLKPKYRYTINNLLIAKNVCTPGRVVIM